MKRVIVHIDRLVLNGFPRADRHAIAEGLREELGRLIAQPGDASNFESNGNLDRLKVSGVRIGAQAKPGDVGNQAARGIAREIRS
jgi:hypothetical protein